MNQDELTTNEAAASRREQANNNKEMMGFDGIERLTWDNTAGDKSTTSGEKTGRCCNTALVLGSRSRKFESQFEHYHSLAFSQYENGELTV